MQTTLNKIKEHSPCTSGWKKLLNYLGKTQADDEPLELRTILESNGTYDTIWAFRAVDGKDKEIRLFAADCAELVLPIYEKEYPADNRPRLAIQAARDYANGLITYEELYVARDAANTASDAAWDAASDAAREAARGAVWAANAAREAAWDAARIAANAAWDAASDAAREAARGAVWAANAAREAAWAAASAEIKQLLLKYI